MNKRLIISFLVLLAGVIVIIVVRDMASRSPGRGPGNPYKLGIDTFLQVDPALIRYSEFRQIRLDMDQPAGIALIGEHIFLAGDSKMTILTPRGERVAEYPLPLQATCIEPAGENLVCIGFRDWFGIYRDDGTELSRSERHSNSSVFTALALKDELVYIADAGTRRVLIYDRDGNFRREFKGETGDGTSHGFIVPSANFHLDFDPSGKLWVTNPGIHTLQCYSDEGGLEESWSRSSPAIDGFSGCCNPAKFTFLPDGRFLTSEKGLVRVKVYSPAGEFESVVAAPDNFTEDGHAPDLAVDARENIVLLDTDRKMIRFYKPL
jgi:hypothetical protein